MILRKNEYIEKEIICPGRPYGQFAGENGQLFLLHDSLNNAAMWGLSNELAIFSVRLASEV